MVATDYNPAVIEIAKQKKYESLEKKDWDVLASDGNYPATRLSGVPLGFKESKIDYIIVSSCQQGLGGEEITVSDAQVHQELINGNPDKFRRYCSDHVPVTVPIRIQKDTDKIR